jgi:ATP-dependent Zn protease
MRLLTKYRLPLDQVALALLERETLVRDQLEELLVDVSRESRSSETIGTVRALPASE